MKKILVYMKGYGKECLLGPLFKLLEASFELLIPLVVAQIVDVGIGAGDRSYITKMCLVMVLLGLVGLASAVTAQFFAAKAAVGFAARLREALMGKLLRLRCDQMDRLGTSTMITRMTSDVNQIQNGVNLTLRLLLRSPFVVFGAMIMAFTIDRDAALIFAGAIGVLCVIVFGIMLITMPMHKKVQSSLDGVTASVRENLEGVRVLRAFCKEEEETASFADKTLALQKNQLSTGRISSLMNPITLVIVNLAVILLLHGGAIKVQDGILTQGLVVALYNYMAQILVELIKMANLIITITKAAACGNRVQSVLELDTEETPRAEAPDVSTGSIEFRNVSMRYSDSGDAALEQISFRAEAGQTVGVIGGTGAGKSSLINLISGLYTASDGEVLLDDKNITAWDGVALRRQIGTVPQKAVLFRGTLRENLCWGKDGASDDELWDALRAAQAEDVVREKPEGLDATVEQGGRNFSGGQRQRLTIARALVRRPGVLILDDSASALDYATDARLRQAIRRLEYRPTTFIVSQRAASVRHADLILVLDDGRLVGKGTHGQLLEQCEVYQEIYYSQFQKEGAADEA